MNKQIKRIVLDFGHGGLDRDGNYTTAPAKMHRFPNGDIAYEGVINRWLGEKIIQELSVELPQLERVMTVHFLDSHDVSLADRVKKANSYNPEETIFVSIHCNAANTKARGSEVFTTEGQTKSDTLAQCIANEIKKFNEELGLPFRKDTSDGDDDKEANFYVLRKTNCPAVLVEVLFFDNAEDYRLLRDPIFQSKFAKVIVRGIKQFVSDFS